MRFISILLFIAFSNTLYSASGERLYKQKCQSCHGVKAEKKAMGKSKVIASSSINSIIQAMHEYDSGKRKTMGYVKKRKKLFLKHHSEEELKEVARYIHSL